MVFLVVSRLSALDSRNTLSSICFQSVLFLGPPTRNIQVARRYTAVLPNGMCSAILGTHRNPPLFAQERDVLSGRSSFTGVLASGSARRKFAHNLCWSTSRPRRLGRRRRSTLMSCLCDRVWRASSRVSAAILAVEASPTAHSTYFRTLRQAICFLRWRHNYNRRGQTL
ncbi:hypothetical protein B0H16DRAFT_1898767, partial [Mycena metata]